MTLRCRVFAVYALAFGMAACSSAASPVVCTANFAPAIVVEVRDGAGQPAADGARGAVHDGAYVDSLRPNVWDGGQLLGFRAAYERAGTYTVTVEKPGYQSWQVDGVRVTRDECHVRTQRLVATLVPAQ
jgi:hypothetical protein